MVILYTMPRLTRPRPSRHKESNGIGHCEPLSTLHRPRTMMLVIDESQRSFNVMAWRILSPRKILQQKSNVNGFPADDVARRIGYKKQGKGKIWIKTKRCGTVASLDASILDRRQQSFSCYWIHHRSKAKARARLRLQPKDSAQRRFFATVKTPMAFLQNRRNG